MHGAKLPVSKKNQNTMKKFNLECFRIKEQITKVRNRRLNYEVTIVACCMVGMACGFFMLCSSWIIIPTIIVSLIAVIMAFLVLETRVEELELRTKLLEHQLDE